MSGERVLVTGAAGLLGSHAVAALSDAGYRVAGFDRRRGTAGITWHVGDVTDAEAVGKALQDQDAVVHVAAVPNIWSANGETIMRVNTIGSWIVLDAAERAGVRRVVLISSDSVAGITVKEGAMLPPLYLPIDGNHPLRPTDPYGLSKVAGETVGRSFADRGRLEVLALRPVFVAYPEMYPEIVARARDPAAYRGPIAGGPSAAGGGPVWHYIDPRDAARAIRLALEAAYDGFDAFYLSAATTLAPEPTLARLEKALGSVPQVRDPELYRTEPFAPLFDLDHARRGLGFAAEIDLRPDIEGALERARA